MGIPRWDATAILAVLQLDATAIPAILRWGAKATRPQAW